MKENAMRNRSLFRRVLSLLLALVTALGCMPAASAEGSAKAAVMRL